MAAQNKRRKTCYHAAVPNPKRRKPSGKAELCPGHSGILITTSDQERFCVPEAYNLLNEYADQLYGPEHDGGAVDKEDEDIASSLAREMEEMRNASGEVIRRFQAVNTGTKHLVFVRCQPPVDPVVLVHHMLSSLVELKEHKARYCQRFIPVSAVCHATDKHIQKCATALLAPLFHQLEKPLKFAIAYKARNNQDVSREEIIKTLAELVTLNGDYPHRVDLVNPDLTIVVEIVKANFCISVVKDYQTLKRYNIQSIVGTTDESTKIPQLQPTNDSKDCSKEST